MTSLIKELDRMFRKMYRDSPVILFAFVFMFVLVAVELIALLVSLVLNNPVMLIFILIVSLILWELWVFLDRRYGKD